MNIHKNARLTPLRREEMAFSVLESRLSKARATRVYGVSARIVARSERGADRAAVMYTLIQTARLNDFDPQAWLADVLARINDHRITEIDALLPWRWAPAAVSLAA